MDQNELTKKARNHNRRKDNEVILAPGWEKLEEETGSLSAEGQTQPPQKVSRKETSTP